MNNAKPSTEKVFMDKLCGQTINLNGDDKPGTWFQLTDSSKYKSNMKCDLTFQAPQQTQRFVITVEKMDISDCPNDLLQIYDGATLLNKDTKQQCGKQSQFTFTTTSPKVTFKFSSNANIESYGFQVAIALHFPAVAQCPQLLGFWLCKNKNCISKKLQCDGHDHCGDGTDELSCSVIGKK